MTLPSLASSRLEYRRLSAAEIEPFHALVVDEHVRRYLLDGQAMDRPWCEAQLAASDALFAEHGVGLWLAYRYGQPERPIGFCGFIRFDETGPDPQLLYALLAEHAGQGLATEMGAALIAYVRALDPRREIISAVDEPNAASVRVLEKLGFERTGESPGKFGRIWHYRLKSHFQPLSIRELMLWTVYVAGWCACLAMASPAAAGLGLGWICITIVVFRFWSRVIALAFLTATLTVIFSPLIHTDNRSPGILDFLPSLMVAATIGTLIWYSLHAVSAANRWISRPHPIRASSATQ